MSRVGGTDPAGLGMARFKGAAGGRRMISAEDSWEAEGGAGGAFQKARPRSLPLR